LLRSQTEALQARYYDLEFENRTLLGQDETYGALIREVRETVREHVPTTACVAVLSKGDDALLDLYGRQAWHFPRAEDGRYAGYYPRRDCSTTAHLEVLRARGAEYFLLPDTSRWWLDHYAGFSRHLARRYRLVTDRPGVCALWSLRERPRPEDVPAARIADLLEGHTATLGHYPAVLDWNSGAKLQEALPEHTVFSPCEMGPRLPYLDSTVDVVVIGREDHETIHEATRVASKVLVNLDGGDPNPEWLAEVVRLPSVSIVIPCHDGAEHTEACLGTLGDTLPDDFAGEIITVDDGSTDGTHELLIDASRADERIRVIRHDSSRGFLRSCNRGARAAKCDYLLFLNNDTILMPGWLQPLLRTFTDFPDAGAVGGRLLFPDGRLQEAGGLVFEDGSAAKVGYYDDDAEAPLFAYVRETDYVSAALLMTPRELFRELGGFDRRYGFGYYDDDDYCFAVRASGRGVYYQPESTIVHVEGASAGTDLSAGLKHFQVKNQALFARKWRAVLTGQPARPEPYDWAAVVALAGARR
jgi:GT2 family glycosyltransferase